MIQSKKSQTTQAVTESWLTHTSTYTQTQTRALGLFVTSARVRVVGVQGGWRGGGGRQIDDRKAKRWWKEKMKEKRLDEKRGRG